MISVISEHLDELRRICREHGVARLDVFGLATRPDTFDPGRSDVDFIVSFPQNADLGPWLAPYFELRDELSRILELPVDLVMERAIQDPLFLAEANRSRRVIYAAQNSEAA